jgi:hypothetical protein
MQFTVNCLILFARYYKKRNAYENALKHYKATLTIRKKKYSEHHSMVFETQRLIDDKLLLINNNFSCIFLYSCQCDNLKIVIRAISGFAVQIRISNCSLREFRCFYHRLYEQGRKSGVRAGGAYPLFFLFYDQKTKFSKAGGGVNPHFPTNFRKQGGVTPHAPPPYLRSCL